MKKILKTIILASAIGLSSCASVPKIEPNHLDNVKMFTKCLFN